MSVYFPPVRGSGAGSSPYFGGSPPAAFTPPVGPATASGPHHGSLFGNLARNVEHSIEGTGVALGKGGYNLYQDAAHGRLPAFGKDAAAVGKAAKGFAASEKKQWVPVGKAVGNAFKQDVQLLTGDVKGAKETQKATRADASEAYKVFHADPLAPLLDVATLFTAGAARAGALGSLTAESTGREAANALLRGHTAGELRTIKVRAGHDTSENVTVRTLPRNAARSGRMQATDRILKTVTRPETRIVGEFARAARAIEKDHAGILLRGKATPELLDYMKARGKLNKWEAAAVAMRTRLPDPKDLQTHIDQLLSKGTPDSIAAAQLFSHPEFQHAYHETISDRSVDALHAGRALTDLREQNLAAQGHSIADLAEAPYRHMRVLHGARWEPDLTGLHMTTGGDMVRVAKTEEHYPPETLFHGSPEGQLGNIFPHSRKSYREGSGFYLTTDIGKARKYAEGKTASGVRRAAGTGAVGGYRLRPGAKVLNVDTAPEDFWRGLAATITGEKVPAATWKQWARDITSEDVKGASSGVVNRARLMHLLTGWAEMPSSDAYYAIEEALVGRGYHATLHHENGVPVHVVKDETVLQPVHGTSKTTVDVLRPNGTIAERELHPSQIGRPLQSIEEAPFLHQDRLAKTGGLVGGPSVEELKASLDAQKLPHPYYIHDELDHPGVVSSFRSRKLPRTPPADDVHASKVALFQMGLLALHPDMVSAAYIRSVAHDYNMARYDHVRSVATPVPKGVGKPTGYEWVRERRGERIPHVETHVGDHRAALKEQGYTMTDAEASAHPEEVATDGKGQRLAIPKRIADGVRVEQKGERAFLRLVWDKSTEVWRAMVLNLRVPWLENNVIGNHFLLALRFAGIDGLRGYLNALREVKGVKAVTRILRLPDTQRGLTQQEMHDLFIEHTKAGTYVGANLPTGILANAPKAVRVTLGAPGKITGILPKADRASEGMLRRAAVNAALGPEARRVYRQMPKQTRDWHQAYLKAATNPDSARLASREVNDALGSFLSLTEKEQHSVRALVPFYAWFREITRIALKLPLDAPGRTDLLARLGQAQPSQDDLRSYLRGNPTIAERNGILEMLSFRSTNPLTTPIDLARAVTAAATGNKQGALNAYGMLNPIAAAGLEGYGRAAFGFGGSAKQSLLDTVTGLPEIKPFFGKTQTNLYPTRTREQLLEQLLGDPRRFPDASVARQ